MKRGRLILLVLGAIVSFHLGFGWQQVAPVVFLYLGCLFMISKGATARQAFWSGMVIGLAIYSPWLVFFWTIFGGAAFSLWSVLALWLALFLLTANAAIRRWPRWGMMLVPMLWMGFEYARSELYILRFSWLNPGMALSDRSWLPLVTGGMFGVAALAMLCFAIIAKWPKQGTITAGALGIAVLVVGLQAPTPKPYKQGPKLVGIQLEFPLETAMMKALDTARLAEPDAELFVLGEYCFPAEPPQVIRDWCDTHNVYLIAGGKASIHQQPGAYFNTAFVIGPTGETVFQQAKSVPIQFFDDGTPAPSQTCWRSPWGKIGLAICYDLSYSRVVDGLVKDGAEALIIPTMDMMEWGKIEHEVHSRMGPLRAREYGVGVVRVCTSGISQIVEPDGTIISSAEYPGVGKVVVGHLPMSETARVPLDRHLAPLASAGSLLVVLMLIANHYGISFHTAQGRLSKKFHSVKNANGS